MTDLAARLLRSIASHADRLALTHGDEVLSYRDVGRRVAEVSRTVDLRPGEPVGLITRPDLGTRILYLAALTSGAVVVPIGGSWPDDRVGLVADSLGLRMLVGSGPMLDLPSWDRTGPDVQGVGCRIRPEPARRWSPAGRAAGELAYILHTSGSTGKPKGVPVTRKALEIFLDYVVPRYQLGPEDRVSATFDLSFDLAAYDLLAPMLCGSSIHLPVGKEFLVPAAYAERAELTHWFSVPSMISSADQMGAMEPETLPTLRWSLFCGEAMTWRQAELWREAAPRTVIENLYGPTELTLACSQYQLPASRSAWPATSNGTVPIGAVYPHLRWRIGSGRDSAELLVDGAQRFAGYVDPADDEEAFEATPDGSRWYRTGDRVEELGSLLVHRGRIDRQVQLGGLRVELGEVEGAFRAEEAVKEAAVVTVQDDGVMSLVAFLVGDAARVDEVLRLVRERVPGYMVPEQLCWVDAFPLNANGKVDYRTLERRASEELLS